MSTREHSRRDWIVAFAALVGAAFLLIFGRGVTGRDQDGVRITITVIPVDFDNLNCRGSLDLDGARCAYGSGNQPLPVTNPLKPYVTLSRELLLLSGVFEESHVAAWLHQAQATRNERRVTLECSARTLGEVPSVEVQWQPGPQWSVEKDISAARIRSCAVLP